MNKIKLLNKIDQLEMNQYMVQQMSNYLDILIEDNENPNNVDQYITDVVCSVTNLTFDKISSSTRVREIIFARYHCFALEREYTSKSLKNIGMKYGKKDHSTVIHGLNEFHNLYQYDSVFRKTHDKIKELLDERIRDSKEREKMQADDQKRHIREKHKHKPFFFNTNSRHKQYVLSKRQSNKRGVLGKLKRCDV
jgi:hypothetical protein